LSSIIDKYHSASGIGYLTLYHIFNSGDFREFVEHLRVLRFLYILFIVYTDTPLKDFYFQDFPDSIFKVMQILVVFTKVSCWVISI